MKEARRFASSSSGKVVHVTRAFGLLTAGLIALTVSLPAAAQTLERIRQAERISLGYVADTTAESWIDG